MVLMDVPGQNADVAAIYGKNSTARNLFDLKRHNLQTGEKFGKGSIGISEANGLAETRIGGRQAVAVSQTL